MIDVCRLSKTKLWEVSDTIYNLQDYQSQYIDEGLQIRDNNTKKDYLFKYSVVFSDILKEKCFPHKKRGIAFIKWTKTKSIAAQQNRFIRKEYINTGDNFAMDGFPFKQGNITILDGILIENREILIPFLLEYIRHYSNYRIEDDGGDDPLISKPIGHSKVKSTKVWMAPSDGSLSSVEQKMLQKNKTKEGKIMNKLTQVAGNVLDVNKDALKLAAKLEVGKVATAQLKKVVKPKLPMMVRGYADSPLFDIVLANAVGVALREYASNNEKAQIVAEAMIQSAAVEMVSSFNINDMINEMLETIDISKITGSVSTEN